MVRPDEELLLSAKKMGYQVTKTLDTFTGRSHRSRLYTVGFQLWTFWKRHSCGASGKAVEG